MAEDPDIVSICNVGDAPCQLSIAPAFNGVGLVRLRPGERWARPDSRSINEIERLETLLTKMAVDAGVLRFDAERYKWVRSHWDQLTGLTWREPIAEKFDAYVTEAMRAPAPEPRDG